MIGAAKHFLSAFDGQRAADIIRDAVAGAGITIGGDAPWDIRVTDDRAYARILRDGTLGAGEAYMEGWWDCDALDQMIDKVVRADVPATLDKNWVLIAQVARAKILNLQATRAFEVGQRHYDVGNDLYEAMLDPRMIYTCAYWRNAETLAAAQEAKLDLVCRKIGLQSGMRVLDLGCGWGGFASFAAERYGVTVVGYTVSREQVAWAQAKYAGLPVDIRFADYRTATGSFDAVVSIGLMEHIGPKNQRAYMEQAARCLAPGGVAFVHTICGTEASEGVDPWFDKYIFPNAAVPSLAQLVESMQGVLVPEDIQNIGPHYDRTLLAWWERFDAAWPSLRERYGDRFYRMWKFYLLVSAGYFRARRHNLYQVVATPTGASPPVGGGWAR